MANDTLTGTYGPAVIQILTGDITQISAQAIVTLINSEGFWFGGVDRAIIAKAGNLYHTFPEQALNTQGLRDGDVVVAPGPDARTWSFKDVIFVIDDLSKPLDYLTYQAVRNAYEQGYQTVSLPLMRTGVMRNQVEQVNEVPRFMADGIKRAVDQYQRPITITVVAYQDKALAEDILKQL